MTTFEEETMLQAYLENSDKIPEGWATDKGTTLCNEPDGPLLLEIKEQKIVAFIKKKVVSCWSRVKDPDNFPGPQPVSLERSEIIKLSKYPYAVCEKTDGMRYFLLVCIIDGLKLNFIIDRKFSVFEAPGAWSCASSFEGTLLDGEIVRDKDGNFIYYPHDCILRGGINYSSDNFKKRYDHTKEISVLWRTTPQSFFTIIYKKIKNLKNLSNLLSDLSTSHAVDGLIFTPIALPIQTGTQHSLIKWKMPDKHTFDFEVERKGQRLDLYLFDNMSLIKYKTLNKRSSAGRRFFEALNRLEELSLDGLSLKDTKPVSRFIVECELDGGDYIPIKTRPDKTRPNSVRTIQRTLQNIEENITITELLDISKKLCKSRQDYIF
tara:strand:+ start:1052 stop:2185 length:1134 start_codon:yes stop_codon:yes gene_type:complete